MPVNGGMQHQRRPTVVSVNLSGDIARVGNELVNTPDFSANIALSHELETASSGTFETNLPYSYNGSFFWAVDNRVQQPAVHTLNGQLQWTAPAEKWWLRLWGKNLLDEKFWLRSMRMGLATLRHLPRHGHMALRSASISEGYRCD